MFNLEHLLQFANRMVVGDRPHSSFAMYYFKCDTGKALVDSIPYSFNPVSKMPYHLDHFIVSQEGHDAVKDLLELLSIHCLGSVIKVLPNGFRLLVPSDDSFTANSIAFYDGYMFLAENDDHMIALQRKYELRIRNTSWQLYSNASGMQMGNLTQAELTEFDDMFLLRLVDRQNSFNRDPNSDESFHCHISDGAKTLMFEGTFSQLQEVLTGFIPEQTLLTFHIYDYIDNVPYRSIHFEPVDEAQLENILLRRMIANSNFK